MQKCKACQQGFLQVLQVLEEMQSYPGKLGQTVRNSVQDLIVFRNI